MLLAILVKIMIIRTEGKRRRTLANLIPGTNGVFIFGSLPLIIEGPEKLLNNLLELYRK